MRTEASMLAYPQMTPGVRLLLIVNVAVFAVNFVLGGQLGDLCAVSWAGLWEGYGLGLLRLITYQFVHSYHSPMHLLMNMLVLYFFGTRVEETIGRRRLLWLYVLGGVTGGLLESSLGAITGMDHGAIGASGACYAILLYATCMAPHSTVLLIVFPIKLWILSAVLVGIGVYQLALQLRGHSAGDGVAHGGHVGGALYGYVAWRWRYSEFGPLRWWRRRQDDRRRRIVIRDREIMDRLLEKVHREGIGSLTPAERRFMEKTSRSMQRR